MIPQPAFHGLTHFAHEVFSLTHLSAFFFLVPFQNCWCLHLCVEQFFMPLLLLPPLRSARRTHTLPISKGLSFFCFFEF